MSFATDQVALLKTAYAGVLKGQTVRYGERQLTRADAAWISGELDKWMRRANAETRRAAGGNDYAVADFSGRCDSSFRNCG